MDNVLELNNWIICAQAAWKVLTWTWPVVLAAAAMMWMEYRAEKELSA